jgi:hypothetical protein
MTIMRMGQLKRPTSVSASPMSDRW